MVGDGKAHCATLCMVMSAWAVPLMAFFGYLCMQESPMIELPREQKSGAAWGCFGSAFLYALTFFGAMQYKSKVASRPVARQVQMQEMAQLPDPNRY
mmetsp:Transcript_131167/g.327263  ORF Transcript_131167/g.327263 Transcript_131167/m.327263 type:complete len:97 (+) Transcript_131167:105-395(+)